VSAHKSASPNLRPVGTTDGSPHARGRNLGQRSLVALLILFVTGASLASYYGWKSLTAMRDQLASVQEQQAQLASRLANLQGVVGAISLEMTDQSLTRKVSTLTADVTRLQNDVDLLESRADEHALRISDAEASLDEMTGPFWNPFQDRNLDELNDAVLDIETHLDQLHRRIASVETNLARVDESLRHIETCLSRFSDFIPGC